MERLKGFNLGGWFSQVDCIEEKDPSLFLGFHKHLESFITDVELDVLKNAGANHVRLPVDWFNLFNEDTLEPKEEVFSLLENAVSLIRAQGLLVILDLHKCPGHDFHLGTTQEQSFFTDPLRREQAREVWRELVSRFGEIAEFIWKF